MSKQDDIKAVRGLVDDIQGLIAESDGVAGLHRNGGVAPWGELEAGGQFERLSHLPAAIEALQCSKVGRKCAELPAQCSEPVNQQLLVTLKDCEARLALLVAAGRGKLLDAVAAEKARAAIAAAELSGNSGQLPAAEAAQPVAVAPVDGDLLPAIGDTVLIHLSSPEGWFPHRVVGYYVWKDHGGSKSLHRVFVRVADVDGHLNARPLDAIRRVGEETDQQPASAQTVAVVDEPTAVAQHSWFSQAALDVIAERRREGGDPTKEEIWA